MNGIDATRADFYRVEGWLISLFLHGLLLSTALPLFRLVPINIPPEPFRWDINLVRSTQVTHEQTIEARATERHVTSYTAPAAIPAEVQNTSRTPTSYAGSHKPVSSIHESAVATEAPLRNVSSTVPMETTSIVQESAQSHNVAAEVTEPVSSSSASENSSVPAPFTNDSSGPESEPIATPGTPEQPVQAPVVTGTGSIRGRGFEAAAPKQPEATTPAEVVSSSAPRTDYSWLQRAIFQRLEELKRSSRPSLDHSSPLKVLVKAVVSNEGHLMDTEVLKSSGLDRIDKEAVALVQRAFPIQLDRALDRQRIVMRIPITYSRD
jgi:TonB family protein